MRRLFGLLSNRFCYERCEGAGKNAVSWACHCGHWYSHIHGHVGEVGSWLFIAIGNLETGFSDPFLLTS